MAGIGRGITAREPPRPVSARVSCVTPHGIASRCARLLKEWDGSPSLFNLKVKVTRAPVSTERRPTTAHGALNSLNRRLD